MLCTDLLNFPDLSINQTSHDWQAGNKNRMILFKEKSSTAKVLFKLWMKFYLFYICIGIYTYWSAESGTKSSPTSIVSKVLDVKLETKFDLDCQYLCRKKEEEISSLKIGKFV